MAEINIQRKKSSPSPWLLVLLALAVLGLIAYFFLRSDTGPSPTPAAPAASTTAPVSDAEAEAIARATPPPADGTNNAAVADMAAEEAPATPDELAAFAAETATPDYGRRGLRMFSATLSDLADRADLRDPAVSEKRNDLTSATSRLNEANASLKPGLVAVTALLQAMQQKAYPDLEGPVSELTEQARQLSGRQTAADQPQLQAFFTKAAEIVRALSESAS
ncbi:Phospholipase_D-nuclease N-terminal [Hymenobacter daecheongensis DSM 21074]|uniref:Phospholipase_D-nuclease N-terminal n=1 Tax=Hymenobacter daecheongensis DSM 21074 TaxID=1121955 RepID=A0A1M6A2Y5_9BACT|nr:hypothetical protein [Hymenobacter daecheongensis]SHI30871.1 Phospholipase_D-nuclease N-terminal [Hymenobacter daecheongensis DSM 21074]